MQNKPLLLGFSISVIKKTGSAHIFKITRFKLYKLTLKGTFCLDQIDYYRHFVCGNYA